MSEEIPADDPESVAENFAKEASEKGYELDFSLRSLEIEVDRLLENSSRNHLPKEMDLEANLTAYIGETICRLFNGQWTGTYYGASNRVGINFYSCKVTVKDYDFFPSHFIGYYLRNGKEEEGSFYEYLYIRDHSEGIAEDFLGGGLMNKLTK